MSQALRFILPFFLAPLISIGPSQAGLNAGAQAKIYWIDASNHPAGYRNESSCTPRFLITATGLNNFRGADCQVQVFAPIEALPPSWQFQPEGCADGAGSASISRTSFPSGISSAWDGVPGLADAQHRMYYGTVGDCLTLRNHAVIWLESAGTGGVAMIPSTEYGLFTVAVDQSSGLCGGDCSNGSAQVCLSLYYYNVCGGRTTSGPMIQLLDANGSVDDAHVSLDSGGLSWNATNACFGASSVTSDTWGKLKRTYR